MKHRVKEFLNTLFVLVVMSLLILGFKTEVKAAYNPTGCVDFVRTGLNSVSVGGWAFDRDQMSKSIEIHVYVEDSDTGREYGVNIGSANGNRPDVNNVYGCGSNHGFTRTFNVPSSYSGKRQEVYVYAINIYGGNNVLIGQQSVYIPSESRPTEGTDPTGSLDLVSAGTYQVSVGGWAFDKDKYSHSLDIHVYVGEGSNEYGINIGQAKGYRPDVGRVYGCGNYHGFTATFNVPENLCGKRQEVYVYAINIFGGNNVCIGHKSVYIPSTSRPKEVRLEEGVTNEVTRYENGLTYYKIFGRDATTNWCGLFARYILKNVYDRYGVSYTDKFSYDAMTNANRTAEAFQKYKYGGFYSWRNYNWSYPDLKVNIKKTPNTNSYRPKVGDIILIDWDNGKNEVEHIGLIAKVNSDGSFVSIEGNTGNKNVTKSIVTRRTFIKKFNSNVGDYVYCIKGYETGVVLSVCRPIEP